MSLLNGTQKTFWFCNFFFLFRGILGWIASCFCFIFLGKNKGCWNVERYEKVEFSTWNIFGKNTETWSLTAKSFCLVLRNKEKKSKSVPAPECRTMMEKKKKIVYYIYIYM